jgi:hypothetical protein
MSVINFKNFLLAALGALQCTFQDIQHVINLNQSVISAFIIWNDFNFIH